jgi:creatinine amidohydrolase
MTVKDMREALTETKTVLIPLGITEQHGHHLPLDTDTLVALEICRRAAAQTGAVVAPEIRYAYSGGELPGTLNIATYVVQQLLVETLRELARHGFENLLVVLGHGGSENTAAVQEAVDMFQRINPHLSHLCIGVYKFFYDSPTTQQAFEEGDYHAGWFETSLMLAIRPDLVRMDQVALDEPTLVNRMRQDPDAYQTRQSLIRDAAIIPHVHQDPTIEIGVMGDPHQATKEKGEKILQEAVDRLVSLIARIEAARRQQPE